ncbi:hypothetical protein ACFQL1_19010 [Halomicroarcula sp. GCM10025709]|uniref:hypothetical protein n=1 Tax=Haloarcula TaxID=2237 RepID=UPI0024C3C46F|nr:hypothetical protein [Halomicroarcula sp. YJ-61-S]
MSEDQPDWSAVTSASEFNDALTALLRTAAANGVDVCGAWECRPLDDASDWEAMIVELADEDE